MLARYLLLILLVAAVFGLGMGLGGRMFIANNSDSHVSPSLLKCKKQIVLAEQQRSYATLKEKASFTKAVVYTQWIAYHQIGIDLSHKKWDWNFHYNNGILSLTAPPIKNLSFEMGPVDTKVVNKSILIDETDVMAKLERERIIKTQIDSRSIPVDENVREMCRLKLAELIKDLVNQVNQDAITNKIVITFLKK